jgi:cystathionine beta-lyase/cystathionine gamma-synthase
MHFATRAIHAAQPSDSATGALIAPIYQTSTYEFEPIKFLQNAIGAVPAPLDCWLTLRGLKTLDLRMQRHAANAAAIAAVLRSHPRVERVHYPGFGGIVSFELNGTHEDITDFVSHRRYFALGESLGGVRSLICHPASMTHASIPAERRRELGLSDRLIRLSPGIEHPDDLVDDLCSGLDVIAQQRSTTKVAGV